MGIEPPTSSEATTGTITGHAAQRASDVARHLTREFTENTTMTDGIRPYGPGKFNTILDAYVYDVSMDGAEVECGSVDENGVWYGVMRHGHTIFKDGDPSLEELTPAERDLLMHCAGVILSENDQGFVSVEYFDTMEELDAAWAEIEQEIES